MTGAVVTIGVTGVTGGAVTVGPLTHGTGATVGEIEVNTVAAAAGAAVTVDGEILLDTLVTVVVSVISVTTVFISTSFVVSVCTFDTFATVDVTKLYGGTGVVTTGGVGVLPVDPVDDESADGQFCSNCLSRTFCRAISDGVGLGSSFFERPLLPPASSESDSTLTLITDVTGTPVVDVDSSLSVND